MEHLNVEDLKHKLTDYDTYKDIHPYIDAVYDKQSDILEICSRAVVEIMNDSNGAPLAKFMALKFVTELIETRNSAWLDELAINILPCLETIALFKSDSKDPQRGKEMFLNKKGKQRNYQNVSSLMQVGESLHRLALECISVWSKWYPLDPRKGKLSLFRLCEQRLVIKGVEFLRVQYFHSNELINLLSVERPAIELLRESRALIKLHIDQAKQIPLVDLQAQLKKTYIPINKNNRDSVQRQISYCTLFQNAVHAMKTGQLGPEIEVLMNGGRLKQLESKLFLASSQKQHLASSNVLYQQTQQDKERMLHEINKHINQNETIQKQLTQSLIDNNQLKMQLAQSLKEIETLRESIKNQNNQPVHQEIVQVSQDRLMQRRDAQIHRLTEQLKEQTDMVALQNKTISDFNQHRLKLDDEIFNLQEELSRAKLSEQSAKQSQQLLQTQLTKVNEQVHNYKEQLTKLRKGSFAELQQSSQTTQQLQTQNAELVAENQSLKDEVQHLQMNLKIAQQEIITHKDNLKKLDQMSKTQTSNFMKNESLVKTDVGFFRPKVAKQ